MKCLYGIGVGPGDPEMMTMLAVRTMRESDVILVPGETPEKSVAFRIAAGACPEIKAKEIIAVAMPMTKDREILRASHKAAADTAIRFLDEGKQVSFLTLGDPTVYSTYMYVHRLVGARGYETRIVNGITSFCAAAARLNMSLTENSDELHVLPASYQIEEGLLLSGTKVLMKAGKKMAEVKSTLDHAGKNGFMVENCCMEGEKIYSRTEDIPDNAGYFSLLIVKEDL